MAGRFEAYREDVVRRFYEEHFSRFDRQIVLIDLLSSLNAGPGHFADTRLALEVILRSFRYGETGFLGRLFSPRIDKVLFAATKADHVAHNQHANLKQLLELLVTPAARSARLSGIQIEVLALSALRSTDVVRTEHHGQALSCVRGHLRDEDRETVLFPGEIPPALPEPEDWTSGRFRFRDFAPRRLVPGAKGQHIRLDQALEYLIGDKLA
jgi:predicted YcjX-like family ATPase